MPTPAASRRSQLLDVAAELVRQADTADVVTMEAVARGAGVSKPVVYKWFPNRDTLLIALFDRESGRLDDRVRIALSNATTFEDKTRAMSDAYIDMVDGSEPSIADVLARTVAAPAFHVQRTQRNFEVLATIAAMTFEHFDITEAQSLTAAVMIAKSLEGVIELWRGTAAPRQQVTEDFVAFCLAGLDGLVARKADAARGE